ncbi:MAG: ATP-binding protein [candidate division FCPU426 bacterium]
MTHSQIESNQDATERRKPDKTAGDTGVRIKTGLRWKFIVAASLLSLSLWLTVGFLWLTLPMPTAGITRTIYYALFLLVFIGLSVIQAWYLSHTMIAPIQSLARAMKLVTEDDDEFDVFGLPTGRRFRRVNDFNLHIHTNDEIEQLADEFQAMIRKLEKSYTHMETIIKDKNRLAENLQEMNVRNEAIIRERTREVVEKNLRLYETTEELQLQKDELIIKTEQLEDISRMKSDFLASMSHELRTPLNSIIGFAEVLKHQMFGELNEKQLRYVTHVYDAGRHLLDLINNILDISKVEAGKMELLVEPYSLNRLIDEVHNTIRTLAYKKNIEIFLQLGADIVMQGDAAKFKQILYNLMSNAIKFTDEKGKIWIRSEEVPSGRKFDGGTGSEAFTVEEPAVLLSFQDTGIGIKEEEMSKLFVEFEQTSSSKKRKYEGTGLGLALTRKLVLLHGGHIWVKSQPEKGTLVEVVLPQKASQEKTEETNCP